jgi:hypothetical protein
MSIDLATASPITGPNVYTGFTSPTYTFALSGTSVPNGRIYVVTAKGGTQPAAVDIHSASRPFSTLVSRPATIRGLPAVNANGVLPNVPVNTYVVSTKKGTTPLSGQASVQSGIKTQLNVAAGVDLADPSNLLAMISAHIGVLSALHASIAAAGLTGEV